MAKIIIELGAVVEDHGVVRLGYDAYNFQKEIPGIIWTDKKTGDEHKMGEFFTVAKVTTVQ